MPDTTNDMRVGAGLRIEFFASGPASVTSTQRALAQMFFGR